MKHALFLGYILLSLLSFGQVQESTTKLNTFHLENIQNKELNTVYSERIIKGNFESFRLKNTPIELIFEEGFKCILIPANELTQLGIDPNQYQEKFPDLFLLPIFHFTENGGISAVYKKFGK
jgi:hypothetical protein